MFKALPPLAWLRAFEASARLGSFTRAATELNLTPSAVSYQVRALEGLLGHRLFDRQRRVLVPTRLAQGYLPIVAQAFAVIDAGTAGLFGSDGAATLTIRCLSSLNLLWLVPRLDRFRVAHPGVRLRLLSTSWSQTDDRGLIDIDIRYGNGSWPDGMALPLLQGRVVPVCAPGRDGPVAALQQAALIEITGTVDGWPQFRQAHAPDLALPEPVCVVDQSLVALEMAVQGHGHALVADVFAAPYLTRGTLVRACPGWIPERLGHHLVVPHSVNRHRPEIVTALAWLQAEARATQDALAAEA